MNVLESILADTRQKIDALRTESQQEARDATAVAEQMAGPTDAYRALEAEEADLARRLDAVRGEMKTARSALDAMADERDRHTRAAEAAANAAEYYEARTLPDLAALLDDTPPHEALAATGLMRSEPKPPADAPACAFCGEPLAPHGDDWLHWHGVRDHPAAPDHLTAPGVVDSRAEIAALIDGSPLVSVVDRAPARPDEQPRHAKPKGSRITGAFRALVTGPDDQPATGDEQDGDDRG